MEVSYSAQFANCFYKAVLELPDGANGVVNILSGFQFLNEDGLLLSFKSPPKCHPQEIQTRQMEFHCGPLNKSNLL